MLRVPSSNLYIFLNLHHRRAIYHSLVERKIAHTRQAGGQCGRQRTGSDNVTVAKTHRSHGTDGGCVAFLHQAGPRNVCDGARLQIHYTLRIQLQILPRPETKRALLLARREGKASQESRQTQRSHEKRHKEITATRQQKNKLKKSRFLFGGDPVCTAPTGIIVPLYIVCLAVRRFFRVQGGGTRTATFWLSQSSHTGPGVRVKKAKMIFAHRFREQNKKNGESGSLLYAAREREKRATRQAKKKTPISRISC